MATAIDVAGRARHRGITTVLDGGSWKPGTDQLLACIDAAICSADFRPPGCETPHAVAAFLRGFGVRAVAISRGGEPVLCWEGEQHTTVPVPRIEVIDTLGAGDVLHGAFCHVAAGSAGTGWFLPAIEAAVDVASRSCAHRGTRAWLDADHRVLNNKR
jgi:sugar/nucleoside kinase (ribokinase family)